MIQLINEFTTLLTEGKRALTAARCRTPELDAGLLLADLLGIERARMLLDPPATLPTGTADIFRRRIARRAAGEPVHYITGKKEFYNHTFRVGPAVLIPRPETEEMVEAVLRLFPRGAALAVADVGAGSGCIAISLGLERPEWRVTAIDLSADALDIARENAARLEAANISFVQSDIFTAVPGPFDIIVSNPPYIDYGVKETLQVEVRKFEPPLALFAAERGLAVIRELVAQSAGHLKPGGSFFCEIGYDQKAAVEKFFEDGPWTDVVFIKDISGHDRIVRAERR
ncbi:MAG: peptide chain release factor N(5)-glutamine methyltransferase [Nitrospinae bacterium]|nr:peptide chain release factor N(5)-glutamine methyltransferase [Nitrospinota bacterium]